MPGKMIQVSDVPASLSCVHRTAHEILFDTTTPGYQYAINLDRLDLPEKVLSWVAHMGRKTWVTAEMLSDFIELAHPDVCEITP